MRSADTLQKSWGLSSCLFEAADIEAHCLHIVRGGHSSCHRHMSRDSLLLVESGRLKITTYDGDQRRDVVLSTRAPAAEVLAGAWHRFEALEPTCAVELYRAQPGSILVTDDIVRRDTGGVAALPAE
jgi:hypothetical protein